MFVKVVSQCGLSFVFEVSNLKQFNLVSDLIAKAREHIEMEGFGTYNIYEIFDLQASTCLSHDKPLVENHVYQLSVRPQPEDSKQKVKHQLRLNFNIVLEDPHQSHHEQGQATNSCRPSAQTSWGNCSRTT